MSSQVQMNNAPYDIQQEYQGVQVQVQCEMAGIDLQVRQPSLSARPCAHMPDACQEHL